MSVFGVLWAIKNRLMGNVSDEGLGNSIENAIVIQADTTLGGIDRENKIIRSAMEKSGNQYEKIVQELLTRGDRKYDAIHVLVNDKEERVFYFDITAFYGKGQFWMKNQQSE